MTDWVKAWTSASVMRPLGPLPLTSAKGTPNSRANLRTDGEACGSPTGAPPGMWAAGAAVSSTAMGAATGINTAGATETVAAEAGGTMAGAVIGSEAGVAAGVTAAPATSSISTSEPSLTLSPSCTLSSFTTPAWLEGISIEALSDSTVIRLCSARTLSPGLTMSSITVTSAKSPISGTLISMTDTSVSLCSGGRLRRTAG